MIEFLLKWGIPVLIVYTLTFIAVVTYALWKSGKFKEGPNKQKEVLAFIGYLHSEIKERPQCMLFAMMLKLKFDDARIKYNTSHFITEIDGYHYDWDGVVKKIEGFIKFPQEYGDNHIVNHYNAIAEKFRKV